MNFVIKHLALGLSVAIPAIATKADEKRPEVCANAFSGIKIWVAMISATVLVEITVD